MAGLRELKKLQVRHDILSAASDLFAERGFEDVTVEEVAEAAGVSKKTVFNYFPAKEDLVFSRFDERENELIAAVRHRPAGTSVLDSFRASALAYCDQLADAGPGTQRGRVFTLIEQSPVLARRWHQLRNHYLEVLAGELAADAGVDPDDPLPWAIAAALLGAERSIRRAGGSRLREGADPARLAEWLRPQVNRIYDQLAAGLADYP
ncbi:TetR family transcriptional regulator [Cryptosporangium phraense]|uniref:TetR family transcriptional regulator n=1 Tax=Cryptosporangium phraense TaxID=2593070 RepID=A0A545AIL2_9ACTN|nr:TetR family transcriptional regulator [Cryptosporangium phraense]TQS41090.1 TetR family transcriptional regulator [Cryptosporangium phraense]